MPTKAEIPEKIKLLLKNPNGQIGEIEKLIITLGVDEEVRILIHRQISLNLLPPSKQ